MRDLVWRNSDLPFDSLDALLQALRMRPSGPRLRLVEQADDFDALLAMVKRNDVRRRAHGSEAIELLWDVCRIPDYRKLMLESHIHLLAQLYAQLSGPTGAIELDWMRRRLAALESVDGDIESLMNRLAFVRTWTYVTQHERWLADARHWQEHTQAIEDRLSDALHRRLTERFVGAVGYGRARAGGASARRHAGAHAGIPATHFRRSRPARGDADDEDSTSTASRDRPRIA